VEYSRWYQHLLRVHWKILYSILSDRVCGRTVGRIPGSLTSASFFELKNGYSTVQAYSGTVTVWGVMAPPLHVPYGTHACVRSITAAFGDRITYGRQLLTQATRNSNNMYYVLRVLVSCRSECPLCWCAIQQVAGTTSDIFNISCLGRISNCTS
jgi:hypothetical protein